ncbi:hypothetical protein [Actinomadura kijaniata]|uniref:hypothetical protein n=1 Tax=Actinomadura kijaniata TaxID=46161 RepID=UPI000A89CA0B|nr:hypothetical protein [Actinomadura kijaniata]
MAFGKRAAAAPSCDAAALARAHGVFNVLGGAWPLVSMRSFEWVFGPKEDEWLEQTVAGLLVAAGWSQLRAGDSAAGREHARRVGVGTAATLLAIDLIHVPRGRLRWTYLLDGAMEAAWLLAWWRTRERRADGRRR